MTEVKNDQPDLVFAESQNGKSGVIQAFNNLKNLPMLRPGTNPSHKSEKTDSVIFLCEECEAVWFSADQISFATFNYFHLYMERLGLPALWTELDYPMKVLQKNQIAS